MDNEWEELDIANLPPDILVGDYEFVFNNSVGWDYSGETRFGVIKNLMDNAFEYRYRKRATEAPTHEEIRKNHIKSVKDSIMFSENGFRDTIIDAILFILKSSVTAQEEKS